MSHFTLLNTVKKSRKAGGLAFWRR